MPLKGGRIYPFAWLQRVGSRMARGDQMIRKDWNLSSIISHLQSNKII